MKSTEVYGFQVFQKFQLFQPPPSSPACETVSQPRTAAFCHPEPFDKLLRINSVKDLAFFKGYIKQILR